MGRDRGVSRLPGQPKWSRRVASTAVALCSGLASIPAYAADDAQVRQLETMIQKMEAQHQADMKALQAQLDQLKTQQSQGSPVETQKLQTEIVDLRAQQVATEKELQTTIASGPRLIESPTHQFGFTSADGANTVAITARLMIDGADYFHTVPAGGVKGGGPGGLGGPLDSGVNARRARLGISGTLEGDWAYRLIYDFGSSADSVTPGVSGAVTSGVENAYVTYNGFYKAGNTVPIAIDLGYLDVPWTLDESTSSNDIMFLERSSSQVIATEFGGGDFRSGFGVRSNDRRYWAGIYLTGPTSGAPHTGADIGNYSALARLGYQLYQDDRATVHVGVNGAHLFNARSNTTTTSASSISTVDSAGANLALSDRPELRVDPTVLLNTGNIPINSGNVIAAEAAGTLENFFVQGEFYAYTLAQRAGGVNPADGAVNLVNPDLNFDGGYVEASYTIGGRRKYIPETGAYSGVIPDVPFSLSRGGIGAFELAARYSAINLNDHFTPGHAPHLTGGINGGNQVGVDVGLNWYPSLNLKFMLDYIHTDVSDLYKASTGGAVQTTLGGATINAVAVRSQFLF